MDVVEARGLMQIGKNLPDPIAQVALLDMAGRENKNEIFRTKPQPGTITPHFNQKFQIGKPSPGSLYP